MDASLEPFAIIHSSGSTVAPEPTRLTHGSVATAARWGTNLTRETTVLDRMRDMRILFTIPVSISPSVHFMMSLNIEYGWVIVLPPTTPPNTKLSDTIMP